MQPEDKNAFLTVTACEELQAMRISHQIREELDRSRALRNTARAATSAREPSVDRVRRRLAVARSPRAHPLRWGLAAAVAFAAVAFLVGRALPWSRQAPPALQSDLVALELDGLGTVEGTREEPVIQWESGTVRVAVTPQRGVNLAVVTPEATVRVVGTEFAVDRSDFATRVTVSHGTVEVTCAGSTPARLAAPQTRICLPDDAPTLLRRVSALRRQGASAELRRQAIDRGLEVCARGSGMHAELLAHRAELLASTGEKGAALEAATAYLAIGGPRNAEMAELEARLQLDLGASP